MNAVWSHLVGWIVRGATLAIRAVTALVTTAAKLWGFFLAGPWAVLLTAARWVEAQVRELVAVLNRMVRGAEFPAAAWAWADAWNDVGVARLRERQRTDPSTSSVRDHWHGLAAERYYDAALEQARAVDGALAGAELMRDQLRDCAIVTGLLYGALCSGLFEFVGVLCAATALTATGVAAPEGIGAAVGAVADFVVLMSAIIAAICAYHLQSRRVPDALDDILPGGWPSPHASTYADGSLSDGDTTDWRLWM